MSTFFVFLNFSYLSCFLSGKKLGFTFDNKNFHNVSLGQGQEAIAEQVLDLAAKNGHWVILQVSIEIY